MVNLPPQSLESRDRLIERLGGFQPENIALADFIHSIFANVDAVDPRLFPLATSGVSTLVGVDGSGNIKNIPTWFVTPLENDAQEPIPAIQSVIPHAIRPSQAGLYFAVDYSSSRSDSIIYGYSANVKRTGSGSAQIAVGVQLNAFEMSTAGSPTSIFGGATEAWAGDHTTEPSIAATLIGWESAVISQRHDNTQRLVGINSVFKNRRDGATTLLHGSIGDNQYNYNSMAFLISSQAATATGEHCGWKYGIYFDTNSLDLDTAGGAIGIDMTNVLATKLAYAMRIPGDSWFGLNGSGADDIKFRYLSSSKFLQFNKATSEFFGFDMGTTLGFKINAAKVLGTRKTGWSVDTGTAKRTANVTYSGTAEAVYTQATIQTLMDAVRDFSQTVKALKDDLHATAGHGIIGT